MGILTKLSRRASTITKRLLQRRAHTDKVIVHCGYHKVGTVLFNRVLREISQIFSNVETKHFWNLHDVDNLVEGHFRGIHVIRDPRDVIVSGYLYHLYTNEAWCVNNSWNTEGPITFPQVPHSQKHRPEKWKKKYIQSLKGKSYQENLQNLDLEEGIIFEMTHYAGWTIEEMLKWDYGDLRFLEIKFEDIIKNYDLTFEKILDWCGFTDRERDAILRKISRFDIARMSDKQISVNDHIHGRETGKWRQHFSPRHKKIFKELFGDAVVVLGYESDNNW